MSYNVKGLVMVRFGQLRKCYKTRIALITLGLLLIAGVGRQAVAAYPETHGFEFERSGVYELSCSRILLNDQSDPLMTLASYLHMRLESLELVLSRLQQSSVWPLIEGLFIYGSRAHQYWGRGYDLDVLLLPFQQSAEEFARRLHRNDPLDRELDNNNLLDVHEFRVDYGNSGRSTIGSILRGGLMTKLQEKEFLSIVQPALQRAKELAYLEVLLTDQPEEQSRFEAEVEQEKMKGNPFFTGPFHFSNFALSLSWGYRTVATSMGLWGIFLTTKSPIILKEGPETSDHFRKLRSLGYERLFLFSKSGRLAFAP